MSTKKRTSAAAKIATRYLVDFPELPPSWAYEQFQNILDVQGGSQPPKSTFVFEPTPGYVQLLQIRDFGERGVPTYVREDSVSKRCNEGDILVARYGASLGRILTGQSGAYNVALAKVIYNKTQFDGKCLFYLLQTPFFQIPLHMISRSAQNGFNKGDLSDIVLPIAPLNEQRRIVAKIEELLSDLDAGVAALERIRANLKRYRAAVLKAAVEGRLTEEWRAKHPKTEPASKLLERILAERRQKWEDDQLAKFAAKDKTPPKGWKEQYVEPAGPETCGLAELPKGWCWVRINQLLHRIEGGKSFKCLTRKATTEEWGVIKVSAMTWGKFLEGEQKAIPSGVVFDPLDEIKPNDLLLSRCNTSVLVGATVLVGNCRSRLLLSDKSLRLLVSDSLNLRWLHMALSSSVARRQLSAMATGTSDSMRNVSQEKIESVLIPLPSLEEQAQIVGEIEFRQSIIDQAKQQVAINCKRAARLRQSILKRAFEGKLVPQDPTDEPAAALLERIRLERSKMYNGRQPMQRKQKANASRKRPNQSLKELG